MRSYKIDNALRNFRKLAHVEREKKGLNFGLIEVRQTYGLYEAAARKLGFEYIERGRCRVISDGKREFSFWMDCSDFCTWPLVGLTEDKAFVSQHLAAHGFPVPAGRAFHWRDPGAAIDFGLSLGGLFVVKPAADTQGGDGVFTKLKTKSQGLAAFRRSTTFADQILVEQYVTGENLRVLIYKGRCLSAVHRQRPFVVGDGRSTIAQLVARTNEGRIKTDDWNDGDPIYAPLVFDKKVLRHLATYNLTATSVPTAGETVTLADLCNYSYGSTLREALDDINPAIIRGAVEAAELLGAPLAGFDIIAPSLDSETYCINEVNVGPGLTLHYLLDNPEQGRDPLAAILADVFQLD